MSARHALAGDEGASQCQRAGCGARVHRGAALGRSLRLGIPWRAVGCARLGRRGYDCDELGNRADGVGGGDLSLQTRLFSSLFFV